MAIVELVFLGHSNAFGGTGDWSCCLIDGKILLDAPPTVLPRLRERGGSPADIETIFISHLHADHIFGIPFILLDHFYLTERTGPLNIIGPSGIETRVRDLMEIAYPGMWEQRVDRLEVRFLEVEPGNDYSVNDLKFKVYEMNHGHILDVGYQLEYAEGRIAYSGDTAPNENLTEMARTSNILIVEMSSVEDKIPGHMTINEIFSLREVMDPTAHMIVTHLPELDIDVQNKLTLSTSGVIQIAQDMKRFVLNM